MGYREVEIETCLTLLSRSEAKASEDADEHEDVTRDSVCICRRAGVYELEWIGRTADIFYYLNYGSSGCFMGDLLALAADQPF